LFQRKSNDKGKPVERQGRKATGLKKYLRTLMIAKPPNPKNLYFEGGMKVYVFLSSADLKR
jgi:hypothetical protein